MIRRFLCVHSFVPLFAFVMALTSESFFHGRGRWGYYEEEWMIWQYVLNFVICLQSSYWALRFKNQHKNFVTVTFVFVALLFNPLMFNPITGLILPGFRMGIWDFIASFMLVIALYLDRCKIICNNKTFINQETSIENKCDMVSSDYVDTNKKDEFGNNNVDVSRVNYDKQHFSLKSLFIRLFSFSGCIDRKEYLIIAIATDALMISIQFYLQIGLESLVTQNIGVVTSLELAIIVICSLILAIIKFAAITKRIHDLGKGGWWAFVACLVSRQILLDIMLIIFLGIKKGTSSHNW